MRISRYFQHFLLALTLKKRLRAVLFLVMAIIVFYLLLSPFFASLKKHGIGPLFIYNLTFAQKLPLKSTSNRTNILLLGIGGQNHQGYDLTDLMMMLSISQKQDLAIISLPRDIWSPTLKDKINSAFHYGEIKKKSGGIILSKSIAEEIVDIPIHYGMVIDFAGFKKLIDLLGGIDVFVDQEFTDPRFPIPGREEDDCQGSDAEFSCRFKQIHFSSGWQHFNGERALEFVRSRNAMGTEGGDLARVKRQQKVFLSIKEKIIKEKLFLQPKKVKQILDVSVELIETDMVLAEFFYLGKALFDIDEKNIRQIQLVKDVGNGEIKGFLVNPPSWQYDGRWVLVPPDEDYSTIHQYINCQLFNQHCPITFPQ